MNANKRNKIWRTPIYLPYLQPELTETLIAEAESKIGFKFPEKYLDLLKIQNGGYIRYTLSDTPHRQISGIGPNFPSILNYEWLKEYEGLSFEIEGLFPFDGDGHWNICLDYRVNKAEPTVTYIDTEGDYERIIANSFEAYLDQLVIETDGYVIDTNEDVKTIVKRISEIANIEFGEPSDYAHGYLEYTGKLNESWVWVSPNKVPRGFVRPNDERYETLKSGMEGTALRYSEVSENSVFIGVSEADERELLFEKLQMNGMKVEALQGFFEK